MKLFYYSILSVARVKHLEEIDFLFYVSSFLTKNVTINCNIL